MATCPTGHDSGTDDYCEVCGRLIAGGAQAAPGAPPEPPLPPPPPGVSPYPISSDPNATAAVEICPQCKTPREEQEPFCEGCRWNFLTGTPGPQLPPPLPPHLPPAFQRGEGQGFDQPRPPGQVPRPSWPAAPPQSGPPQQSGAPASRPGSGSKPAYPGPPGHPGQPGQTAAPQPTPAPPAPGRPSAQPQHPDPEPPPLRPQAPVQFQPPQPPLPQHTQQPGAPLPSAASSPAPAAAAPAPPPSSAAAFSAPAPSSSAPSSSAAGPDFVLAPPSGGQAQAQPPAAQPEAPTSWYITVSADRDYFTAMMARSGPEAQGLFFPPYCPERRFELTGNQLRIGRVRHRPDEEIPEIDLSRPPEDPGVSHRHAVLVQQPDHTWTLVDQGSTNGTTVNGAEEPVKVGVPIPLAEGDRIHVGAWTTITLHRADRPGA